MANTKRKSKETTSRKKPVTNQKSGIKKSLKPDERHSKILGLILLFTAFLMFVSFVSYLTTFQADRSEVLNNGWKAVQNNDLEVRNALGRIGAVVSHFFIYKLFGIPAFLVAFLTAFYGSILVFRKRFLPVWKTSLYVFLTLFWLSTCAGFLNSLLQPESGLPWGGAFGSYLAGTSGWLTGLLKPIGTGALLFLSSLIVLVWVFNIRFDTLLALPKWVIGQVRSLTHSSLASDSSSDEPHIVRTDESLFEKDGIDAKTEQKNEVLSAEKADPADAAKDTASTPSMDMEVVSSSKNADKEDDGFELIELEKVTKKKTGDEDQNADLEISKPVEEKIIDTPENKGNYDPTLDLSSYKYPSLDLLEDHGSEKIQIDADELERNKNQIIETLNNYNIQISKIKATIGPTVTLYEIVPAPGIRISKIKNLEDDIALSLAALGIRIIAPIPGKGTVGIEVPNEKKEIVSMKTLLSSEKFRNTKMELPIALGKTIANEIMISDLAKMPHLLMAGATGQGKSVGINAILVSLLYHNHPSQLKFVLVDPKKVELSLFNSIEKHFLAKLPGEEEPIITDVRKVVNTLNALCIEMDQRYDLLKMAHARNIKEYNKKFVERKLNPEKGHKFMPYIVLIVDEFADLIMTAGKEVETPIGRLAQLARAIGIHLILATQRPSVNIITGTIKANFPARVSFKVTSKVDSRTILDVGGAEQLIGRGDMLLSTGSDTLRLQCGFVDTPEVEEICKFISDQQGYPDAFMLPEYIDENEAKEKGGYGADERDELFEDAARVIVMNQMGSTSLIQRRLKLGYNRAGRLMDQLEDAGIVGPNQGSKAREVYIHTEAELEQYLQGQNATIQ